MNARRRLRLSPFSLVVAFLLLSVTLWAAKIGQDELDGRLYRAIERENAEMVETLLLSGANPNSRVAIGFEDGFSLKRYAKALYEGDQGLHDPALFGALIAEDRRIPRILLKYGADPLTRRSDGETTLMMACYKGDLELAKELVARGVDWRAHSSSTTLTTAIQWASIPDDIRCARMLLDLGASANEIGGPQGVTPLSIASSHGNMPLVRLLLERGADAKLPSGFFGGSAIHSVCGAYRKPKEERDRNALEIAKLLIAAGADPKAVTNEGSTTALLAAQSHPKLLKYLIDQGVEVDRKNKDGLTTMSLWANGGDSEECCEILLKHGADPNAKDHMGKSALANALVNKMPRAARALIRHGARLKSPNPKDWDPLYCAVISDDPECIRVMAEAGADLTSEVEKGVSAIQLATRERKLGSKKALELLMQQKNTSRASIASEHANQRRTAR